MKAVERHRIRCFFQKEQKTGKLHIPNLDSVDWDLLDYLSWVHPSGHLGYVMRWFSGHLCGMTLRRTASGSSKPRYEMCSWCGQIHRTRGTALYSVVVRGTDGRRTLGGPLCSSLDCSLRIRHLCSDSPTVAVESLSLAERTARLDRNMYRFFQLANRLDS